MKMDLISILKLILSFSVLCALGFYIGGVYIYKKKTKKLKDEVVIKEKLLFDDLKNEYGKEEAEKIIEDLKDKFDNK